MEKQQAKDTIQVSTEEKTIQNEVNADDGRVDSKAYDTSDEGLAERTGKQTGQDPVDPKAWGTTDDGLQQRTDEQRKDSARKK